MTSLGPALDSRVKHPAGTRHQKAPCFCVSFGPRSAKKRLNNVIIFARIPQQTFVECSFFGIFWDILEYFWKICEYFGSQTADSWYWGGFDLLVRNLWVYSMFGWEILGFAEGSGLCLLN